MNNSIENKNNDIINSLRKKLIDSWFVKEWEKFWIKEIKEWVFAVWNKNLWFYENENWDTIFDLEWIYKDLWEEKYNDYLKKLWYIEKKDQNWYYHMINIKTWKELPQESSKYYEIFNSLSLIIDKRRIYIDNKKSVKYYKKFMKYGKWVYKEIADILEDLYKEVKFLNWTILNSTISPLEYFSYLNLWLVEKQDILKYTKEIFNIEYFRKYYENKWFKLLEDKEFEILLWEWKANFDGERILFKNYKTYKISLKPSVKNINLILEKVLPFLEKLELRNTKNKQEQEKIRQRYEELKEYLLKKKEELKHTKEVKKHISELENDITNNLW